MSLTQKQAEEYLQDFVSLLATKQKSREQDPDSRLFISPLMQDRLSYCISKVLTETMQLRLMVLENKETNALSPTRNLKRY